jgi:hypothetical protein
MAKGDSQAPYGGGTYGDQGPAAPQSGYRKFINNLAGMGTIVNQTPQPTGVTPPSPYQSTQPMGVGPSPAANMGMPMGGGMPGSVESDAGLEALMKLFQRFGVKKNIGKPASTPGQEEE